MRLGRQAGEEVGKGVQGDTQLAGSLLGRIRGQRDSCQVLFWPCHSSVENPAMTSLAYRRL